MTPAAGDVWLADAGHETRRLIYVVSDARFHRLSHRVVVAPLIDKTAANASPWYVVVADHAIAVNQLGTLPVARLLELVDRPGFDTLRRVRRAVVEITR